MILFISFNKYIKYNNSNIYILISKLKILSKSEQILEINLNRVTVL